MKKLGFSKASGDGKFGKKSLVVLVLLLILVVVIGTSYALWQVTLRQTGINQITSSCFKINFTEKDDINLENVYPLTENDGQKLVPFTFTIENICNTSAFYQINLEELTTTEKRLSNNYIRVSLNKSTGKILSTYQSVDKTLDNADISHKLTTGRLNENEKKDFELRLWLDEDTPLNEDVINATFTSKVTIITVHKKDFDNDLNVETKSLTETYTNTEEVIEFTAHSKDYNIIEFSEDNVVFNPVDTPSKDVTITKAYQTDGTYKLYFKDEIGNIIEANASTDKLDQQSPIVVVEATELNDGIKVNLSKSTDNKSGIKKYYYKLNDNDYIESTTNNYTFTGLPDGKYNITVKLEDNAGNISEEKTREVTVAYEHVYISSMGSDANGNGSPELPYATLQRAYNKVKSGGKMILLSNITITSTTNMNTTNKEVTLKSNGDKVYSIVRNNNFTSQVIIVEDSNTLTTSNIILDGNSINANGSIIEARNSILNLNVGTIIQNNINLGNYNKDWSANGSLGGGVYMYNGIVNITGATIRNNKVNNSIETLAQGGGISIYYGTLNLDSGVISNNDSMVGSGGGIFAGPANVNMRGGSITNNNGKHGGGIAMNSNNTTGFTMTMMGGIIQNNVATLFGGGIYANGSGMIIYLNGGSIQNNTAQTGSNTCTTNGAQIINQ